MRYQIISDTHLEFEDDGGEGFCRTLPVEADTLIIAGDFTYAEKARVPLEILADRFDEGVIYVPGNHEYYGAHYRDTLTVLSQIHEDNKGVEVLNCHNSVIAGIRGATLWFPESHNWQDYRNFMADFSYIRDFTPWVFEEHNRHMKFLRQYIHPGDIVITHHLPHRQSIAPQFARSALNRFFLSEDAEDIIQEQRPALWVHGHTHTPCDYRVGDTRIVCAPRGYPGEGRYFGYRGVVVDIE